MLYQAVSSAEREIAVKRSRFIARVAPIDSVADAEREIRTTRDQHPNSNHVVYAFLVGDPNSETAGMSDAGEPKGTAARPVMDHLRGSGLRDVVVTVTRYFGGTKLGTGGLAHAYGAAAAAALDATPKRERIARIVFSFTVEYSELERARLLIRQFDGTIDHETFESQVELTASLPEHRADDLRASLSDLTHGRTSGAASTDE